MQASALHVDQHPVATTASGTIARAVHRGANLIILAGVPVQFYLAGLVMFGVTGFMPHRAFGALLIAVALVSWMAAALARFPGGPGAYTSPGLVFGFLFLQPVLAMSLRQRAPAIAALHVVTGLAVFLIAFLLEQRLRQGPAASSTPTEGSAMLHKTRPASLVLLLILAFSLTGCWGDGPTETEDEEEDPPTGDMRTANAQGSAPTTAPDTLKH
jgi:hypothetical protein